jgi:hypothetical protein
VIERNRWQGFCAFCGAPVEPFDGIVEASGAGYQIFCEEHAPAGAVAPKPAPLRPAPLRPAHAQRVEARV